MNRGLVFILVVAICGIGLGWSNLVNGSAASDAENKKAEALFEMVFQDKLARSPVFQTELGIKTDYDKWDNLSEAFAQQTHQINKRQLQHLNKIRATKLDAATLLSYQLMKKRLTRDIDYFKWRHHNYPVNQMHGWHATAPSILINQHKIANLQDAQDYIKRVAGISTLMEQLIEGLEIRRQKNIVPPKFVFPLVINDCKNLIEGVPFIKEGNDSVLLADFKSKIATLNLNDADQKILDSALRSALLENFKPAYQSLISYLRKLEADADTRAGVWKFPNGKSFYQAALQRTTTTELSADEIHQLGLAEVERIHKEMKAIMRKVKFNGELQQFFKFMQGSPQFYYSEDEAGKQRYLREATELIDTMQSNLDRYFGVKPKANLIVKQVEPFREQSAGKAFYQPGAIDGSRAAIYYANLYNMKEMPIYQMEALAYHEGIPGHHMQISIARELEHIPQFRKFDRYTAYTEGWGLYAELLPKEMGFYQDPYSDFGRLSMELWRACRLVTDTGLHAKKWTREQAINYLIENTPNVERDARRAIERYIVMPSQATAYKIGMNKILELREFSRSELDERFDIRQFHDQLLKFGALPLDILEQQIKLWVKQ